MWVAQVWAEGLSTPVQEPRPTGAWLTGASPLSPKVPEMDGCSPVNFLGVFCFLPDSGERKEGQDLVK